MELLKKISSAVLLSLLIALPLSFLESLTIYCIIKLYEIPYLVNFEYYQIMGLSFIYMITRNRIRINNDQYKEMDLLPTIISISTNRLFRIVFVWSVALTVHYLFFNK